MKINEEITKIEEEIKKLKTKLNMKEASKYPTQEEAEFLMEWSNALTELNTGLISGSPIKDAFYDADKLRMKVWDYAFGDKSPWIPQRGKNYKGKVVWDKTKAEKLGI